MFDPEIYPVDYDFLTQEQKDNILKWFDEARGKYWPTVRQLQKSSIPELVKRGNSYAADYRKKIQVAQEVLQAAGVFVEFGWRGHQMKWFLATRDDAYIREEDFFEERG